MKTAIQKAISDIKAGKMVLLLDDENRENEADLVMAAQYVRPEDITFMRDHTCGIVCLALSQDNARRLQIPLMTSSNHARHQTPFGVSFDAATGISTGVSSFDRARSIRLAADFESAPQDIVMPGHIFPLLADDRGVFGRQGHTEGSVDLMRLAGLQQAAAIAEVMLPDGTMARGQDLLAFAQHYNFSVVSVQQLMEYRLMHEDWLNQVASSQLMTHYGRFDVAVYQSEYDQLEHVVLSVPADSHAPLVRIHSECLTGDVFGSVRCDCGQQLDFALRSVAKQGGAVLYCRQEGRGIGLVNKIRAYELQDQGCDTVEANEKLGFAADCREYSVAIKMLQRLGWQRVRLMTNNPHKIAALTAAGIDVVDRVPIEVSAHHHCRQYLQTKKDKLNHLLQLEEC